MKWNWKSFLTLAAVSASFCGSVSAQETVTAPVSKDKTAVPRKAETSARHFRRSGVRPVRGFRRGGPHNAFFAKLTKEERAKLNTLVKAGKKDEVRAYMKELFLKYRPEEMKKLSALSERYRASQDTKEKEVIRKEMKEQAQILFRKRQEFTRNNILYTERQLACAKADLERLKKHYEHNKTNEAKIIEWQVEQMCLPPEKHKRPRSGKEPVRKPQTPAAQK